MGVNMDNNKIELPKIQQPQQQLQTNLTASQTIADTALQGGNTANNGQQQGLANMFANTGQQVQAGRVQGQQGLAGMLGNYRGMWQPNGGNNYQIVGGVENLI